MPSRRRALLAASALDLQIVMFMALLVAYWQRLGILNKIRTGISVTQAEANASDSLIRGLSAASLLIGLVTGILFLVWLHRANRNLRAFRTEEIHYSPALAVGSFFIPIVSLVWPFMAMREIWKASDPDLPPFAKESFRFSKLGMLVPLWWVLFLARIVPVIGTRVNKPSMDAGLQVWVDTFIAQTHWSLILGVVEIVGAAIAMVLVLRVEQRESQLAQMLVAAPVPAVSTPSPTPPA